MVTLSYLFPNFDEILLLHLTVFDVFYQIFTILMCELRELRVIESPVEETRHGVSNGGIFLLFHAISRFLVVFPLFLPFILAVWCLFHLWYRDGAEIWNIHLVDFAYSSFWPGISPLHCFRVVCPWGRVARFSKKCFIGVNLKMSKMVKVVLSFFRGQSQLLCMFSWFSVGLFKLWG